MSVLFVSRSNSSVSLSGPKSVSTVVKVEQRGFVLITCLLVLVIMTLLALSMFRNFGLTEKLAGNTREKQRSLQTAQSALHYGEWWLNQGNGDTGAVCNAVYDANVLANMATCSNVLSSPTALPWAARGDYLPPSMTVAAGGGLNVTGDINYISKPSLYVSYLGLDPTNKSMLYEVTAAGYGGSANSASVVRSIFAITAKSTPLDQP